MEMSSDHFAIEKLAFFLSPSTKSNEFYTRTSSYSVSKVNTILWRHQGTIQTTFVQLETSKRRLYFRKELGNRLERSVKSITGRGYTLSVV